MAAGVCRRRRISEQKTVVSAVRRAASASESRAP